MEKFGFKIYGIKNQIKSWMLFRFNINSDCQVAACNRINLIFMKNKD